MRCVILVGHGSLRAASGAAMIRLAARVRERGVAPLVEAGFLNYSRPTFAETLARCVARGATEVVVQPYFLIPGKFVQVDVPRLLARAKTAHPHIQLLVADPFGDHEAMAEIAERRADAALAASGAMPRTTALALIAHGSPNAAANAPIHAVAERIRQRAQFAEVLVCFLGLNDPLIGEALDTLAQHGAQHIVAVPYFLQLGGHVAEDLPAAIAEARARHSALPIELAEHLGYDPLLADVISERVAEQQAALLAV